MVEPKEQFADVSVKRLAMIYAEAFLNAAEQANQVEPALRALDSLIDDVLRADARLDALFAGAAVGRQVRQEALQKVFSKSDSDVFYKFLLVLNDHDRLDLIRPIRRAAHDLHDERTHRLRVHVDTATPLSSEQQERIRATVQDTFKLEPILVLNVDPALLGGLKLRIGDKVYDATVRTKIDNLRTQLIARSSHEIQSRRDRFSSAE
jgi:F-type H+-transporting ATPase subunit delta